VLGVLREAGNVTHEEHAAKLDDLRATVKPS
jgi:hypothetical protein